MIFLHPPRPRGLAARRRRRAGEVEEEEEIESAMVGILGKQWKIHYGSLMTPSERASERYSELGRHPVSSVALADGAGVGGMGMDARFIGLEWGKPRGYSNGIHLIAPGNTNCVPLWPLTHMTSSTSCTTMGLARSISQEY